MLIVGIAAAVVLVLAGLVLYLRRPRLDQGLDSWRRHIDALSPEARRQVIDRVRGSEPPVDQDEG
ncbi:MAG: hypothetical protein V9E89_18465 [Ilumatobacteraceae bacterium]|jgi:hypothetical protein